jgi:hypothetical protein
MKPAKTKSQTPKLALRRETILVLARHRLSQVGGGHEVEWPTQQSYGDCEQQN